MKSFEHMYLLFVWRSQEWEDLLWSSHFAEALLQIGRSLSSLSILTINQKNLLLPVVHWVMTTNDDWIFIPYIVYVACNLIRRETCYGGEHILISQSKTPCASNWRMVYANYEYVEAITNLHNSDMKDKWTDVLKGRNLSSSKCNNQKRKEIMVIKVL